MKNPPLLGSVTEIKPDELHGPIRGQYPGHVITLDQS